MKNAREYQQEIHAWAKENFCYQDRIGYGMAEEIGEFCHTNLKYLQKIRGHAGSEDERKRLKQFHLDLKDCLGDAIIFLLHWTEEAETYVSFEQADAYAQQTVEVSKVEILSMMFQNVGRIMYLYGTIQMDEGANRNSAQRLLNNLAAMCSKYHWHFVHDILEPTWKEVKKRNWRKFPKNGLTE